MEFVLKADSYSTYEGGLISACSWLAAAQFKNYTLPAKLVLVGVRRTDSEAADARRWAALT